jgi:hypothetical protein
MTLIGIALGLSACATAQSSQKILNPRQSENVHLLPRIDEQRHARDNCLSAYIAHNDNFNERVELTASAANNACVAEDDKLINLILEMDQDGRPQVTAAVRKESAFQAYRFVLRVRAVPEKPAKPVQERPTPTVEWR